MSKSRNEDRPQKSSKQSQPEPEPQQVIIKPNESSPLEKVLIFSAGFLVFAIIQVLTILMLMKIGVLQTVSQGKQDTESHDAVTTDNEDQIKNESLEKESKKKQEGKEKLEDEEKHNPQPLQSIAKCHSVEKTMRSCITNPPASFDLTIVLVDGGQKERISITGISDKNTEKKCLEKAKQLRCESKIVAGKSVPLTYSIKIGTNPTPKTKTNRCKLSGKTFESCIYEFPDDKPVEFKIIAHVDENNVMSHFSIKDFDEDVVDEECIHKVLDEITCTAGKSEDLTIPIKVDPPRVILKTVVIEEDDEGDECTGEWCSIHKDAPCCNE